jgi:proliferating cell nuclear antigen
MDFIIKNGTKADQFTIIFQHLKAFSDHINIMFEKTNLFIQSMDSAHVCVLDLKMPSSWFDKYELSTKGAMNIGVSSILLFRILNSREKGQQIHFEYNHDKTSDSLCVHLTTEQKGNSIEFDKHFEVPLIDIDSETLAIPQINHNAEFSLKSTHFSSVISQLKQFGDNVEIKCSDTKITLNSNNADQCKMMVEIDINDLNTFSIDENLTENNPLISCYSLNYMYMMCLYNKLAETMYIKISESYPLKVVYYLDGNEPDSVEEQEQVAHISLYLAPKIDDD